MRMLSVRNRIIRNIMTPETGKGTSGQKHLDKAKSFVDARPLTFDILRNAQNMADKSFKISPDNEDASKLSAHKN